MNLFHKLFGRKPIQSNVDPSSMAIEEVWQEFCQTVQPPRQRLLIRTLERPEFATALKWLRPPTACPMAQGTMRAFVDLQRSNNWKELDNLALVYQGDTKDNIQPPQESLDAIANLCVILQIPATVFYKTGTEKDAEFAKIMITLGD